MITLFKPSLKLHRITDITPDYLKQLNVTALILDVDNTLSTHHGQELVDGLELWLENMKDNNIKTVILSNSKEERVKPFAQKIGLDYFSMGLKPLHTGFKKAVKFLNEEKCNIAVVGDQLFTDILGANAFRIKSILLDPILPEKQLRFRFKRKLERILFKIYKIR